MEISSNKNTVHPARECKKTTAAGPLLSPLTSRVTCIGPKVTNKNNLKRGEQRKMANEIANVRFRYIY
jgi:hypothetical protein